MSSDGSDAPFNDLSLYKKLLNFRAMDVQLAEEALNNFSSHLWYLTPIIVVLSLFSEKVDVDTKSRIVEKILSRKFESPVNDLNKPAFPVMFSFITGNVGLLRSFTEDSNLQDYLFSNPRLCVNIHLFAK